LIEKNSYTFYTSTDGTIWANGDTTSTTIKIFDVCYDGTNYIFVGYSFIPSYITAVSTSDFIALTATTIETVGPSATDYSIAYGGGYYNILLSNTGDLGAVYNGTTLSSMSYVFSAADGFTKLRYFDGNFWTYVNNTTTLAYNATGGSAYTVTTCSIKCDYLAFPNGQFKALCKDTTIKQAYSADGSTWQAQFTHFVYVSATEQYGCKADGVFYFNGTTWAELGALSNVKWLEYVSTTEIYAATATGLQKWTGASWALHQNIIGANDIRQMFYISPTIMYCSVYGSGVYKYNGSAWSLLIGSIAGSDNVTALYADATNVYAGVDAEGVFKKTDTIWSDKNLGDMLPDETTPKKVTITTATGAACTVASTADLYPGCFIKHASIPDFAYVVSITSDTVFVLSVSIADTTYTDAEVIYAPIAKYVTVYNNMIWLANLYYSGRAEPSQVMISEIGDMDDWRDVDQTAAGLSGYRLIQLGTGESDVINGMASVNGRLVVFKGKSTYSISSTAPDSDNTTSQKIADVGCIATQSIQVVTTKRGDLAIFMSDHGFYATDGSNVIAISEQLLYNMNSTYYSMVTSVYDRDKREYRVCIPSTLASTECDLTLILNLDEMGWWASTVKATAMSVWDGTQVLAYDRWIKDYSDDNTRDDIQYDDAYWSGDQITMTYTLPINLPHQIIEKELRKLYVQYDGTGTVDVAIYKDGVAQQTTTGVVQDTRYMIATKGKNFEAKVTQATADSTFNLYSITVDYKVLTER
jgi:hypothetical protein